MYKYLYGEGIQFFLRKLKFYYTSIFAVLMKITLNLLSSGM
jgi:hypothetical protein